MKLPPFVVSHFRDPIDSRLSPLFRLYLGSGRLPLMSCAAADAALEGALADDYQGLRCASPPGYSRGAADAAGVVGDAICVIE